MSKPKHQIPGFQILIDNKFNELIISKKLKSSLNEMNMIDMTPIQAKCIPHLLEGHDLLGAAKTGSGKTLAFLVPLVHKILDEGVVHSNGTVAIILAPTRELSSQIFTVLECLIVDTDIRAGVVIGGNNKDEEANYLRDGVTVLVATPGRLLDHLNTTKGFNYKSLHTLIIDEADRLMNQGFLEEMRAIIRKIPSQRQTVLFSATLEITAARLRKKMREVGDNKKAGTTLKMSLEDKVLTLACLSLKTSCVCVDLSKTESLPGAAGSATSTVAQLTQNYIVCDADERFRVLYSVLASNRDRKVMVFMATCASVQFHYKLLQAVQQDAPGVHPSLSALHGRQSQQKRETSLLRFAAATHGVLLCTDVAARGLDVPQVGLVVQFDPPDDHREYIHRVGRTARAGAAGRALLLLRAHEAAFLPLLRAQAVPVTGVALDRRALPPVQGALEAIVGAIAELRALAEDAFRSVVTAYLNNRNNCFDVRQLDQAALARNFGLRSPPHVVLRLCKKRKAVGAVAKHKRNK